MNGWFRTHPCEPTKQGRMPIVSFPTLELPVVLPVLECHGLAVHWAQPDSTCESWHPTLTTPYCSDACFLSAWSFLSATSNLCTWHHHLWDSGLWQDTSWFIRLSGLVLGSQAYPSLCHHPCHTNQRHLVTCPVSAPRGKSILKLRIEVTCPGSKLGNGRSRKWLLTPGLWLFLTNLD